MLSVGLLLNRKMPSSTFHSHQQAVSLSIDHTSDGIWRKTTLVRQISQTNLRFSYMDKLAHLSGKEDMSQLQGSKFGSYIRATNLSSINIAIWAIKISKFMCTPWVIRSYCQNWKGQCVEMCERTRGFMKELEGITSTIFHKGERKEREWNWHFWVFLVWQIWD